MLPTLYRSLLLATVLCTGYAATATSTDTTHVVTHRLATIVTNPAQGENPYRAWGLFPKADYPVRRITLHVTLGSPDSMPTAHWDYCDKITIRRKGGAHARDLHYEIGRMLTPYGSIFGKGWQWSWQVDVTDFAPLLRDSVEIEYLHTGYEPVTVGWALTLDFEIIKGPAIARPLGMQPLWNAHYKYGNPEVPIEKNLLPISYNSPAGSAFSRVRIQHTGHGMDKPRGCSEFCSRWREIYHNATRIDRRDMWKKCGDNPLYPQGGTWIYNRAYWCPGDLQQPDMLHIATGKKGKQTLTMVMEPYTATDIIQAEEQITSFLFHYAAPAQPHDVAIEDILAPTDKQQHYRLNPTVQQAMVQIRNVGSAPLTSLVLHYGTAGHPMRTYVWRGQLAFYEAATITLPGAIEMGSSGMQQFTVQATLPNGQPDAWAGDNVLTSRFVLPKLLPTHLVVAYKTNHAPQDNTISLHDTSGKVLWVKKAEGLQANTRYMDTLQLPAGRYHMVLTDTAGNGLQFWAQPRQGDGYLRLLDTTGRLVHLFESDCGLGEQLSFATTPLWQPDTTTLVGAFSMFPRRTPDKIELEMQLSRPAPIQVRITVDGILHQEHTYAQVQKATFTYSLGYLPKGRFVVEAWSGTQRLFTGRVNRD